MTIDRLKERLRAQPFDPFRIHLADGRHLDDKHPDFIAYSPGGRTAAVYSEEDTFEIVDLLLVTSLKILNSKKSSTRKKKSK